MSAIAEELILAIDCGTQSVRALLVDLRGQIVAKHQNLLEGYFASQEGWLEYEAEALWQTTVLTCQGLWKENQVLRSRTKGLVVTAQRGTVLIVDAKGHPLRPFIVWLDQRRATHCRNFSLGWKLAFKAAGVSSTIDYFTREAELNWIEENEREKFERTHKILLVSGWLNYRLTGRFVDSASSQVGYVPFDFRRHRWASAANWKWQALPVRPEQLPDLVTVGATLGNLTGEAAQAIGVQEGLPVIAGAADKACEILGSGAIRPEIAALSYGTAATIGITTARYLETTPFLPPYPAALPGQYNPEVQISRGYWMVNWFKQQFGYPECAAASAQGLAPEVLFDHLVTTVPPGAQGLLLQPYWTPGIRHPGPHARGAIIGFSDVHTRAHLYRAILEGLAYALREGKERIEAKARVQIHSLRVSGGGSQSDAAMQLTADIFNLPASRPHTFETAGLGAAIVGAVGLGLHRDFPSAVLAMTRLGRTFDPDSSHTALYDELYRRVYRRMFERLEPLYARIQNVLG